MKNFSKILIGLGVVVLSACNGGATDEPFDPAAAGLNEVLQHEEFQIYYPAVWSPKKEVGDGAGENYFLFGDGENGQPIFQIIKEEADDPDPLAGYELERTVEVEASSGQDLEVMFYKASEELLERFNKLGPLSYIATVENVGEFTVYYRFNGEINTEGEETLLQMLRSLEF